MWRRGYRLLLVGALWLNFTGLAMATPLQSEHSFQSAALPQQPERLTIVPSRQVQLTRAESELGIVTLKGVLPSLAQVNQQYHIFKAPEFNYFIRNFHYPYRGRFEWEEDHPPTQVVLHWTANSHPEIPLYTLSAFLRSRRGGRIVERNNKYKNVANYFLTGNIPDSEGQRAPKLVKLTRGDIRSWGDIPRVTAYPTDDAWDDNQYDARGALGVEIESPDFRTFYQNDGQRQAIHNFILLVLRERGQLEAFEALRHSPHWGDMQALYRYLKGHLARIDVDARGTILPQNQYLDKILAYFPDLSPQVNSEARRIFDFVSGHAVVARKYNQRMLRAGRPKDARYHKIDFTEAQVFVVAMDLLNSDLRYHGVDLPPAYDLATLHYMHGQKDEPVQEAVALPRPVIWQTTPSGRREVVKASD